MQILHLEDTEADAELTARRLKKTWPHCNIRRAATREEFTSEIGAGGFDLVLSDYTLPSFSGLAALEMVQDRCPRVPFIFLSGTIGEERAIDALTRGASDYVLKEHSGRLISAIEQVLHRVHETHRRAMAEEALEENREHFRQIVEHVTDLIIIFDLSGRCVYCNPAYCKIVGQANGETGGNFIFDLVPEDRVRFELAFKETIRTRNGQRDEYRLRCADQTCHWVETQCSVIRDKTETVTKVLVVARDISDRRRAELQIRQQAELLDHAQDAIMVRDAQNRIIYWNRGATQVYGWTAEEATGRCAFDLLGEERAQSDLAMSDTGSLRAHLSEMRHRTKSGETLIVQSRWALVQASQFAASDFLIINTDITEKKHLEAKILAAQRAESICLLAGGVAHDINNLLVPILCSAELLEPKATDEEDRRFLSMIQSSAHYAASLVQQLLAFSRGVDGLKTEVSLGVVLRETAEFLSQMLATNIKIALTVVDEPWSIYGDATQLKQVLVNLCMNARDAMPAGGAINITSTNVELTDDAMPDGSPIASGSYVMITVTDTGMGILPENIHRIFEPFFTTKDVGKGIGLGLAAVRGIVKGHEGWITAESDYGLGTSFRIYLPKSKVVPNHFPEATNPEEIPFGKGQCILLVDDDASLREIIGAMLAANGYWVLKAVSGSDALIIFQHQTTEIDLVLTDISMSEMDGFTLIENIQRQKSPPPVLAMSGMAGCEQFGEKAAELNVVLLAKPISRDTLLTSISTALKSGRSILGC